MLVGPDIDGELAMVVFVVPAWVHSVDISVDAFPALLLRMSDR
jgi:hypothetical protein